MQGSLTFASRAIQVVLLFAFFLTFQPAQALVSWIQSARANQEYQVGQSIDSLRFNDEVNAQKESTFPGSEGIGAINSHDVSLNADSVDSRYINWWKHTNSGIMGWQARQALDNGQVPQNTALQESLTNIRGMQDNVMARAAAGMLWQAGTRQTEYVGPEMLLPAALYAAPRPATPAAQSFEWQTPTNNMDGPHRFLQPERPAPPAIKKVSSRDSLVQVDEFLCNPLCERGHGVCAEEVNHIAWAPARNSPRCFCRSPFKGPSCSVEHTVHNGASFIDEMSRLFPLGEIHATPLSAGFFWIASVTFAICFAACWRWRYGTWRRDSEVPKNGPLHQHSTGVRRAKTIAESRPVSAGGAQADPQCDTTGLVESWVKSSSTSKDKQRLSLRSSPQLVRDDPEEDC